MGYPKEADSNVIAAYARMFGDIGQDTRTYADTQRVVAWNRDVMVTIFAGRQPHMAPGLPDRLIAKGLRQPGTCIS